MLRPFLISASFAIALAIVPSHLMAQAPSANDLAQGQRTFSRSCSACHTLQEGQHRRGPSLFGVMGRRAGTQPGFNYSQAMTLSDVIWDEATLGRYVMNPRGFMQGNRSGMTPIRDEVRVRQLTAYMRSVASAR
jgi:cytochrome c